MKSKNNFMIKNKFKESYIAIGKEHFEKEILPQLKNILGEKHKDVVVFVSGSVSHGYCDKLSDIDIGVLFLENLTGVESSAMKLLLKEYWYKKVRITYWDEARNKERIKSILQGNINKLWDNPSIYFFFDTMNYHPIFDNKNILKLVQEKIRFYPEEFFKAVVRGFWITTNDSGIYVAEQCIARKKNIEGYISFYRGLEAILRLIFILNKKYFPPSKWLTTGADYLENDFGIKKFLDKIKGNNLKNDIRDYKVFVAKLKKFMIKNKTIEKESVENCWSILKKRLPWHIFSTF